MSAVIGEEEFKWWCCIVGVAHQILMWGRHSGTALSWAAIQIVGESFQTQQAVIPKQYLSDPSSSFHCLLVLFGKSCQHFSLKSSRQSNKGQEAKDEQRQLPAEIEGHDDCHADVGEGVHDHADLWTCGLKVWESYKEV